MNKLPRLPRLVGNLIKQRRENVGLSQRALGLLFNPPVTTQFISNVERGVTPLPIAHVPLLTKALQIPTDEIMQLLEKEYAFKISGRVNVNLQTSVPIPQISQASLLVEKQDLEWITRLYQKYRTADLKTKQELSNSIETLLKGIQEKLSSTSE